MFNVGRSMFDVLWGRAILTVAADCIRHARIPHSNPSHRDPEPSDYIAFPTLPALQIQLICPHDRPDPTHRQ